MGLKEKTMTSLRIVPAVLFCVAIGWILLFTLALFNNIEDGNEGSALWNVCLIIVGIIVALVAIAWKIWLAPSLQRVAQQQSLIQYCPSCGSKLQPDWEVCGYCGRKLKRGEKI